MQVSLAKIKSDETTVKECWNYLKSFKRFWNKKKKKKKKKKKNYLIVLLIVVCFEGYCVYFEIIVFFLFCFFFFCSDTTRIWLGLLWHYRDVVTTNNCVLWKLTWSTMYLFLKLTLLFAECFCIVSRVARDFTNKNAAAHFEKQNNKTTTPTMIFHNSTVLPSSINEMSN